MGTSERRRAKRVDGPGASAGADTSEPPPRRWGPALIWLGVLLALVAVAVVVSFTAGSDEGDPLAEEPFDPPTFCLTAARFGSVSELDFTSSDGIDQLRGLRLVALQLASLSPDAIADDLDAVGDALQRVIDRVQAIPAEDPAGAALVAEALDQELATVTDQADEAAAYIDRWCGPRPTDTTAVSPPDASSPDVSPSEVPSTQPTG